MLAPENLTKSAWLAWRGVEGGKGVEGVKGMSGARTDGRPPGVCPAYWGRLHWIIPPLSRDEREEKVVVACVCVLGCVMATRKN